VTALTTPAAEPVRAAEPARDAFRRSLWAIALVSAAILFYQIAVTRVLSVVLWYHYAFLSISMAMLGLGAPGVWFALRPPGPRVLPICLIAAAVALPASVIAILRAGFVGGASFVLYCMVALLVPMLALGASVCALLMSARGALVGRMYGADLLGAAAAAALVIPMMHWLPTPQLVAGTGMLPLFAWALLRPRAKWAALAAAATLAFVCTREAPFALRFTKMYDEAALEPLYVKWTPTARLAFFDDVFWMKSEQGFGWGMGTKAPKEAGPRQYWMEQDGSAGTPITNYDGDVGKLGYLFFDATTVAYQLDEPARVAVIGAGGGRDVLSALLAGAEHVDAVEFNRAVIDTISTRFREFSGDLYHAPGVHAHASEGRSFLTRAAGGYDVIQISLIDSWAATAAGAYTLSENNLYTVEAYDLYWRKLSPRGMVTTSRWIKGFELIRLFMLHVEVLRRAGLEHPERHMAVVTAGAMGTIIASKRPFTGALEQKLAAVCEERGFKQLWPGDDPVLNRLLREGVGPLAAEGFDMSPPTDDRPFFFQVLSVFTPTERAAAADVSPNAVSVWALQVLMLAVTGLTLALFFAPFALRRFLPRGEGFWRGSAFFACIGLGFMLIEVPWLQRFVLFLGHPSVAATVVLASLLLGAGAGAMMCARLGLGTVQRAGLVLPVVLGAVNAGTPPLFAATLGLETPARVAIAVALLAPVGFLLGLMFPSGMVRFGDAGKAWFWAVNGACGVLASVASLALAMALGFAAVAWIGVACYLAAFFLVQGRAAATPTSW
jgi:hypothetical protein